LTWGIIGALDAEVALIRGEMTGVEEQTIYGCTFYAGCVGGCRVVVVCASIGTINAAVCTSTLIREFGCGAVVNCGIAGNVSKDLGIMDVVLSSDVVFHDADLPMLAKYYPFRTSYTADEKLLELARRVIDALPGRSFTYRVGRVATGDLFVQSPVDKRRIVETIQPLCVEMEGAAVGQVAYMNNIPFLVIRTMSDNADENANDSYDEFLEKAAVNSSRIVLGMIALWVSEREVV